jgi:hypothetical protein
VVVVVVVVVVVIRNRSDGVNRPPGEKSLSSVVR